MSKIYISDLDGTLLNNEPKLSDFSRKKLTQILEAGVDFTVASARNIASIQQILGDLPLKLPVIEINGAYISNYQSGEHYITHQIERDICGAICELCDVHNCMPFITANDNRVDKIYYEGICNDGMKWFLGDKTEGHSKHAKQIETLEHILDERIVCFTIIGSYEQMKDLYRNIDEKFGDELDSFFFANPYSPEWHWLTIHDKKARKDKAVLEMLNITKHTIDELVVFGDNDNDVRMISLNKMGAASVAVGNAIEAVKLNANEIIGTNEQDSVVRYICENENISSILLFWAQDSGLSFGAFLVPYWI